MRIRAIAACAVLACLAPSCKTWAKIPEHTVTIVADSQVKRGGDFAFCVTLKDTKEGVQVHAAEYRYKISWVGQDGSTYKAKSGIYEKLRVRGAIGKATLHVLGYDALDNYSVIATHTFQVD